MTFGYDYAQLEQRIMLLARAEPMPGPALNLRVHDEMYWPTPQTWPGADSRRYMNTYLRALFHRELFARSKRIPK